MHKWIVKHPCCQYYIEGRSWFMHAGPNNRVQWSLVTWELSSNICNVTVESVLASIEVHWSLNDGDKEGVMADWFRCIVWMGLRTNMLQLERIRTRERRSKEWPCIITVSSLTHESPGMLIIPSFIVTLRINHFTLHKPRCLPWTTALSRWTSLMDKLFYSLTGWSVATKNTRNETTRIFIYELSYKRCTK